MSGEISTFAGILILQVVDISHDLYKLLYSV